MLEFEIDVFIKCSCRLVGKVAPCLHHSHTAGLQCPLTYCTKVTFRAWGRQVPPEAMTPYWSKPHAMQLHSYSPHLQAQQVAGCLPPRQPLEVHPQPQHICCVEQHMRSPPVPLKARSMIIITPGVAQLNRCSAVPLIGLLLYMV